jgi:hypothetical protein
VADMVVVRVGYGQYDNGYYVGGISELSALIQSLDYMAVDVG